MNEVGRAFLSVSFRPVHPRLCAVVGAVLLCSLVCVATGRSQSPGGSGSGQGQGQGQGNLHPDYSTNQDISSISDSNTDPVMAARRIRALNILRQKQMTADADKLLKLARELNDEVASANSGTLTSDELHKIADIEKLARNVRQRMTDETGEVPAMFRPPAPMLYPNP